MARIEHQTAGARDAATELVSGAACELFDRLGLRSALGRIWTALFLSPDPLDAATLKTQLDISSGALSMGLRELMELGLVHRSTPAGERKFFYRAETEMWTAITRVFRERERVRLTALVEQVQEAERLLGEAGGDLSYELEQVQHLIGLGRFALDLLDAFMERTKVELKAAQKWLSMSGRLGGEPLSRLRRRINAVRKEKQRS